MSEEVFFDIEEELKKLPAKPGVYLMHDERDVIIYVGKAISLKNRVRQYFQASRNKGAKIDQMVTHIRRFEYIVTDSELEALVLECNLIKEYRPHYNTMLMDDKTYPYIKVTVGEEYPRILFSRSMKRDRSRYFGPYTSAGAVKDTIELLNKMYHLRSCSRSLPKEIGADRPCLNYQIHQCDAPCQGYISKEEYRARVQKAIRFLNGEYDAVIEELEEKMMEFSENLEFERAAEIRDLLISVRQTAQKQKITSSDGEDKDVVAFAREKQDVVVQVFFIRGGRLIGRDHFFLQATEWDTDAQVLDSFLKQFYAGTPYIPKEILVQKEIEEPKICEEWLSSRKGSKVTIHVPKKGTKEKLMEMAENNAKIVLKQDKERIKKQQERTSGAMKEIASMLGLTDVFRVEAYDISNISGVESVGSMIVFEDGKPQSREYRKFKIRTVKGPNDYASLEEVLLRRFRHGLKEREEQKDTQVTIRGGFGAFPDLIMMDGGKGQVNIAVGVLEQLGLQIPVCGMVKDDSHRTRGLYYHNEELPISTRSESFHLITRMQDEAHRFAIEYHRSLRSKSQVKSVLDDIEGVGPTRKRALLRHFQSVEAIREASEEELAKAPAMNRSSAKKVYEFFH